VRARRPIAASRVLLATLTVAAEPALALKLDDERAERRSGEFAKRICAHDRHCVAHGVLNCRRQTRRVVICRIYDERRTKVQGRYRCQRLARLTLDPKTRSVPVTGLGRWHC
jgi:hypothetical protein